MLLLFADQECWASIFNNIIISGVSQVQKDVFVASCFFFRSRPSEAVIESEISLNRTHQTIVV